MFLHSPARLFVPSPLMVGLLMGGLLMGGLSSCAHHVRLSSPTYPSAGARYVCTVEGECQPATTDVESDLNQSGTVHVILPRQCAGRIHRIVILNSDSSEPTVDVTCSPPEEPIETIGAPASES